MADCSHGRPADSTGRIERESLKKRTRLLHSNTLGGGVGVRWWWWWWSGCLFSGCGGCMVVFDWASAGDSAAKSKGDVCVWVCVCVLGLFRLFRFLLLFNKRTFMYISIYNWIQSNGPSVVCLWVCVVCVWSAAVWRVFFWWREELPHTHSTAQARGSGGQQRNKTQLLEEHYKTMLLVVEHSG